MDCILYALDTHSWQNSANVRTRIYNENQNVLPLKYLHSCCVCILYHLLKSDVEEKGTRKIHTCYLTNWTKA